MDFDDLMQELMTAQPCEHCAAPLLDGTLGDKCKTCGKAVLGRALRQSTLDQAAIDYAGMDPPDLLNGITIDPDFLDELDEQDAEDVNDLIGSVIDSVVPPNAMTADTMPLRLPLTDAAKMCIGEFKQRLVTQGFDQRVKHGNTNKYPKYMSMLFESGQFTKREDFFKEGAKEAAYNVFHERAHQKAMEGGSTPARKLKSNYANGFNCFVKLVHEQGGDTSATSATSATTTTAELPVLPKLPELSDIPDVSDISELSDIPDLQIVPELPVLTKELPVYAKKQIDLLYQQRSRRYSSIFHTWPPTNPLSITDSLEWHSLDD